MGPQNKITFRKISIILVTLLSAGLLLIVIGEDMPLVVQIIAGFYLVVGLYLTVNAFSK